MVLWPSRVEVATARSRLAVSPQTRLCVVRPYLMAEKGRPLSATRRRKTARWQLSCWVRRLGYTVPGSVSTVAYGDRFQSVCMDVLFTWQTFPPVRGLLTYWRAVFICSIMCCCKQANPAVYTVYIPSNILLGSRAVRSVYRQLLVIYAVRIGTVLLDDTKAADRMHWFLML